MGKVNTVVFQPKNTASGLSKCPAGCRFPAPRDWHTRTSLPGSVSIFPRENKWVGKAIITSSKFPLVIHRAAQGGIGCYTHVIGLLFNNCLVSPESELYGITQLSQGPVSRLHSDSPFHFMGFFLACIHHIEYSSFLVFNTSSATKLISSNHITSKHMGYQGLFMKYLTVILYAQSFSLVYYAMCKMQIFYLTQVWFRCSCPNVICVCVCEWPL